MEGSFEELQTVVNFILKVEDCSGEVSEDKKHNAKTYKVGENSVRFYSSTQKLKLYGANHAPLRDGLLDLLSKQNLTPPLSPSPSCPSTPPEPPNCAAILKSLQEEVASLRSEMTFMKTQLTSEPSAGPSYNELQEELRISRKEVENSNKR